MNPFLPLKGSQAHLTLTSTHFRSLLPQPKQRYSQPSMKSLAIFCLTFYQCGRGGGARGNSGRITKQLNSTSIYLTPAALESKHPHLPFKTLKYFARPMQ
ncbi:hypothetical protein O181_007122 [Austropuccinia psidii MF-1]|uniref:Uncharacterized protein n=1 Tax=Austropuccinia psidii MF-1 TaxID=1389203 RepID=A0A9Q3BLB5_9BASI|nr:hypothetical protein [Austropuccinia psidii MF-1]